MKNFYYKLMVSSIYTAQNNGFLGDVWKILSNFYVAVAMSCNLMMLFIVINTHLVPGLLNFMIINYTSIGKFNFLINMFMSLIFPIMGLNYFIGYRNSNYRKLITKYQTSYNKKTFVIYFLLSILIPIFYVLSQVEIRI